MINIEKEIEKKFPAITKKPKLLQKSLFKIAQKIIHEDKINKFLQINEHLEGFEFIDATLDYFSFDFSFSSNDIENIPTTGKVVIISNHPLGGLDALSLLKLVGKVRKDVRIVANDFLAELKPLENLFIQIDNFKNRQTKQSVKKIYEALENEEAVIIFPAGEVSRISPNGVRDGSWQKGFLKFAQKSKSPILPILVDAKNSKTFYTISVLNKAFSTILLSDEMFKQKDKTVSIKIGQLISNEDIIPKYEISTESLVKLYKKHLYALRKGKKSFFQTQNSIALPENRKSIKAELKQSEVLGKTKDNKIIYLYSYKTDGAVLKEIGRLREISFRQVDEGVNKRRDFDKYDKYYKHIVLWDEDELEIVGAYRIAECEEVVKKIGKDGLYTATLFELNDNIDKYLENAIELGRSFVQPKYWGTRALDYLWYGIGAYLRKNDNIKYMFGPVSLSATYPQYAKELLVDFYSNYFPCKEKIVNSKIPFEFETEDIAFKELFTFDDYKKDFKMLKSTLSNMGVAVPTLYKQYSQIFDEGGVWFCDFNIDPDFSDCIDGFIFTDITKIKNSSKDRYIGE